jgi:hypothetical protein
MLGNQAVRLVSPSDHAIGVGSALGSLAFGGSTLSSLGVGAAGAAANKVVRTYGNAAAADLAQRASSLLGAEKAIAATSKRITHALDSFVQGSARVARVKAPASVAVLGRIAYEGRPKMKAAQREEKHERYEKRLGELAQLRSQPTAITDRLVSSTERLGVAAPKMAAALQVKAAQAAQFLLDKAPKKPSIEGEINPTLRKWRPRDSEIAKWERYVAAVEDPLSVLDDLEAGRVSREGVEALKAVYPKLYEEVTTQLMSRVSEMQKELPYEDRLQLGILFGVPTDPSLTPQFVSAIQQLYAAEPQEEGGQPGIVKPTSGGLSKLDLSSKAKTSTQRLAER